MPMASEWALIQHLRNCSFSLVWSACRPICLYQQMRKRYLAFWTLKSLVPPIGRLDFSTCRPYSLWANWRNSKSNDVTKKKRIKNTNLDDKSIGVNVLDVPGMTWGFVYVCCWVWDVDRVNGWCWCAGGGCRFVDELLLRRDSFDSSSFQADVVFVGTVNALAGLNRNCSLLNAFNQLKWNENLYSSKEIDRENCNQSSLKQKKLLFLEISTTKNVVKKSFILEWNEG